MKKLYIGCFKFTENEEAEGTFQIAVEAPSLFSAEKYFRDTLRNASQKNVFETGSKIYLLDIVEIANTNRGSIFNLIKTHRHNNSIIHWSLPVRTTESTSYSTALNESAEPYYNMQGKY